MRSQLLTVLLILLAVIGCKQHETSLTSDRSGPVVAEIGSEVITLNELRSHYLRNSNNENADAEELREFLPTYAEYRLKLLEGRKQGLQNDPEILSEFRQYANQLAYRYWADERIKEERIETFQERLKEELKAFHILIELPQDASPIDTSRVYNELLVARDSLLAGMNPDSANAKFSSNRNGNPVGGAIPWISAGSTVSDFEDALYDLSTGEISMPVRTRFGYHLIQLLDKRPSSPQKQVSHIFARKRNNGNGRRLIEQAYNALENDTTWADAVQAYTEDMYSLSRNGDLGWVMYGRQFPEEFVDLVVAFDNDSTYSNPLETDYGYHIIRIDSVRSFSDPEARRAFALEQLEAGNALNPNPEDVRERIAELEKFRIHGFNYEKVVQYLKLNSDVSIDEFELREDVKDLEIITLPDTTYLSDHYYQYLLNTVDAESVGDIASDYLDQYKQHVIEENLTDITSKYFPGFAEEITPFLEGLIVFHVNEENIWNPDTADREKVRNYFMENREQYKTDSTFHYTRFTFSDDSLAAAAIQSAPQNPTLLEEAPTREGSVEVNQGELASLLAGLKEGEFSTLQQNDNRFYIYRLNRIEPPRIPEFDEVFFRVFSDWQPIRERAFINHLKDKYGMTLYPERVR